MADTARNSVVLELAEMLETRKGKETVVLDVRGISNWTDYFIISTMNSQAHMRGVIRNVQQFLEDRRIEPLRKRKHIPEESWTLIDCGDFVVHLMDQSSRDFYELERLWFSAKVIFHSSKSS